ncbi:hypothetical protein D3C74_60630 [compost metagenome]
MSTVVKISQFTAIRLENARQRGISEEALLQAIRTEDTAAFDAVADEDLSYSDLFTYAKEHGEELESAVTEGYRITFNTRGGLGIWISKKFGLQPDVDFTVGEGVISGLLLSKEQAKTLEQRLAANWVVTDTNETETGVELTLKLRALV